MAGVRSLVSGALSCLLDGNTLHSLHLTTKPDGKPPFGLQTRDGRSQCMAAIAALVGGDGRVGGAQQPKLRDSWLAFGDPALAGTPTPEDQLMAHKRLFLWRPELFGADMSKLVCGKAGDGQACKLGGKGWVSKARFIKALSGDGEYLAARRRTCSGTTCTISACMGAAHLHAAHVGVPAKPVGECPSSLRQKGGLAWGPEFGGPALLGELPSAY